MVKSWGKKIEERPTPKTDNAFVLFSENQNTLFQFHFVSVSPHLPPSMGSRKCSETVCTGFTTGSVIGTKGKFLQHLMDVVTKQHQTKHYSRTHCHLKQITK